ncbi:hypothetical protein NW755_014326, partial [Fusarium falciforme]
MPRLIKSHNHIQLIEHMEDLRKYDATTSFNLKYFSFSTCSIFKAQVSLTDVITIGVPLIAPNSDHSRTAQTDKWILALNASLDRRLVQLAVGNGPDFMEIV